MTLVQTEPKKIYLGNNELKAVYLGENKVRPSVKNYATQGPCPDGFHVPLQTEVDNLHDIGKSLGAWTDSNATNLINYLHLPVAGRRTYNTGDVWGQNSYGYIWTSTHTTPDSNDSAYVFGYRPSYVSTSGSISVTYGFPVRSFKNEAVVPNSSWTTIYQGGGSAGIYWNQTDGLISLSSDGSNWITIADKNLGATTVWNSGDTLTSSNVGGYFQRGNNYMFPFSGSVSKTSTQVSSTGYGPGNYYSGNKWITTSPRYTGNNSNLRGGVDGNVPVS